MIPLWLCLTVNELILTLLLERYVKNLLQSLECPPSELRINMIKLWCQESTCGQISTCNVKIRFASSKVKVFSNRIHTCALGWRNNFCECMSWIIPLWICLIVNVLIVTLLLVQFVEIMLQKNQSFHF